MTGRTLRTMAVGALIGLWALCAASAALAQTPSPNVPSSADLVENPKQFDGREIEFTGEAIGESMVRGQWAWIHLNDDAYYLTNVEEGAELGGYNSGMAVYVPAELVEPIEHYGDYTHEGDVVKVTGVFNAACPEHGGDMDIHASRLVVIAPGHHVTESPEMWKLALAIALSAIAAMLFAIHMREHGATSRRRG